jgi:hypothetical protein
MKRSLRWRIVVSTCLRPLHHYAPPHHSPARDHWGDPSSRYVGGSGVVCVVQTDSRAPQLLFGLSSRCAASRALSLFCRSGPSYFFVPLRLLLYTGVRDSPLTTRWWRSSRKFIPYSTVTSPSPYLSHCHCGHRGVTGAGMRAAAEAYECTSTSLRLLVRLSANRSSVSSRSYPVRSVYCSFTALYRIVHMKSCGFVTTLQL